MRIRSRVIAAAIALCGVLALLAGTAAAAPPVKVEGCELVIEVAGKTAAVPICTNGPPL